MMHEVLNLIDGHGPTYQASTPCSPSRPLTSCCFPSMGRQGAVLHPVFGFFVKPQQLDDRWSNFWERRSCSGLNSIKFEMKK